mmetsp:Transcript_93260/g.250216  ORF Transcript_93260/g.250216 Transcript_93260/m.250216 type:complete len:93 (-) Transcript_93260:436-714(-)
MVAPQPPLLHVDRSRVPEEVLPSGGSHEGSHGSHGGAHGSSVSAAGVRAGHGGAGRLANFEGHGTEPCRLSSRFASSSLRSAARVERLLVVF